MRRLSVGSFFVPPFIALLALVPVTAADAPPGRGGGWFDPAGFMKSVGKGLPDLTKLEIVEMARAIAKGSQMGPGDGWFHPSQSRYDWSWLAARHDLGEKRGIEMTAFRGPTDLFQRLDRNRDGVLTPDDFDWSERSAYLRQAGMSGMWFSMMDANSNGRISKAEWEAFFKRLAKGKDHLTPDDLREALMPPTPPRTQVAQKKGGPSPATLVQGLLNGEVGSFFEGPGVGDRAPDFTLKTHDGKGQVRLSQFRGHKPVVLVFGSFT